MTEMPQRLLAATAVEDLERRYQLMINSVKDYAIFMLDPQGRITSWNHGAERLKGYGRDEILGKHFSIFYPAEDNQRDKPARELEIAARDGTLEDEGWRVRKDGSRFWANVIISAIRNEHGDLLGFTKVTRDLTARREADEQLRARTEELEEQKLQLQESNEAMEAFNYSISHDLRAPLRGMWGYATALLEDYADRLDSCGHQYVQSIVDGAARMDALIEDLLAYSRLSRTQISLGPVSLSRVVAAAVSQVKEHSNASAEIQVIEPLGEVEAHSPTLSQVLVNLLSNAVKFVSPGTGARVRVYSEISERTVRLCIEDQGIGIAPEHHKRIFQPFERLHGIESYQGTGIGLAIVRKGIERMRGHLGVESAVGQGARFWFDLPKRRTHGNDRQYRLTG
jgi:PAS domain S-box-containing protein